MSGMKAPGWLRALDVVFGLIAIILSIVVLAYPQLTILMLILMLSIGLLVIGIARIFGGIFAKYLSDGLRVINVGVGALALALAIVAILYPQLAAQMLIYLLSFALMLNGIARLVIGGFARAFSGWLRGFLLLVGVLTIVLSVVVVISPAFGFLTLVFMLAIAFLLNGIARIVSGVTGIR
jgi:uncharacterized membrane protein HdeD (DUF308 family)